MWSQEIARGAIEASLSVSEWLFVEVAREIIMVCRLPRFIQSVLIKFSLLFKLMHYRSIAPQSLRIYLQPVGAPLPRRP